METTATYFRRYLDVRRRGRAGPDYSSLRSAVFPHQFPTLCSDPPATTRCKDDEGVKMQCERCLTLAVPCGKQNVVEVVQEVDKG